jgi:MoxR-like ATPase
VAETELAHVLSAGWELDTRRAMPSSRLHVDELRKLNGLVGHVDVESLRPQYAELVTRLRRAGLVISDRRAVKLQRLIAASAVLCGRMQANRTDFWVLRYIWDVEEEQHILASLVEKAIESATDDERTLSHPRSEAGNEPDPERIAADLRQIGEEIEKVELASPEFSVLKDRLGLLAARSQWIKNAQQRGHLEQLTNDLWKTVGAKQ